MARLPSPTKTHRLKDLCTIEQAEYIAERAAVKMLERYHTDFHLPPLRLHRRLWRTITKPFTRTRV